ncbi:conserved hypothetical protein TIGR02300, putative [Ruegeria sp. R11]|nr:conserved hypothetical protein TIGR02300, putative [Ruegeria sp. R11]
MPKEEWGVKRVCPTTGKRFYDLNKNPIVSPYTGEVVELDSGKSRMIEADAEDAASRKAKDTVDADDVVLDDADDVDMDLGDDVLDDDDDEDNVSLDEIADVASERRRFLRSSDPWGRFNHLPPDLPFASRSRCSARSGWEVKKIVTGMHFPLAARRPVP